MVGVNWTTQNTSQADFGVANAFFTQRINVATSGENIIYTHYQVYNESGGDLTINLSNKKGETALTKVLPSGDYDLIVKTSDQGTPEWAIHLNGGQIGNVVADAEGNFYICGYSSGDDVILRDLDTSMVYNNDGANFAYIAKYNAGGVRKWVVKCNSVGNVFVKHVAINSSGEVAATGLVYTPTNFECFESSKFFVPNVNETGDIFMIVLNENGSLKWFSSIVGDQINLPGEVRFDADGNLYSIGIYNSDPITITDGTNTTNTQPGGGGPTVGYGFLVSFAESDGAFRWFYRFDADEISIKMMKLDVSNFGVYTIGTLDNLDVHIYDQNDVNVATVYSEASNEGLFATKISLTGSYLWSVRVDSVDDDLTQVTVHDNIVDSKGAIYLHGYYIVSAPRVYNNLNIKVGELTLEDGGEFFSGFICKFDKDGVFQWITKIVNNPEGSAISPIWQIKLDSRDNLYITGNSFSEGPVPEGFKLRFYNKGGSSPVFVTNSFVNPFPTYVFSYSPEGAFRWISHFGNDSFIVPFSVKKAGNGELKKKEFLGSFFGTEAINNRLSVTPKGKVYLPLTAGFPEIKIFINNTLAKTLPEFSNAQPYLLSINGGEGGFFDSPLVVVGVLAAVVLGIFGLMRAYSPPVAPKKPTA